MNTNATLMWDRWREPLMDLALRIRTATLSSLEGDAQSRAALREIAGRGEGDWTFGLDVAPEEAVERWHHEQASLAPLSVFTEDSGWKHLGPGDAGAAQSTDPFLPGSPRIVIDPIDGTRPLMWGIASAWVSVALATSGGAPRSGDLIGGILVEIPPPDRSDSTRITAGPTGPVQSARETIGDPLGPWTEIVVDEDDRVDHGFFPVVRYHPLQRPTLARLEAELWRGAARAEKAELDVVWDDQVCSNVAQLVFVMRGQYRLCIDARALLNERQQTSFTTSKPYDVAAALHIARRAGVQLERADGDPHDFPLDATSPVQFAAYHNAATRDRLRPHWLAAVASEIEAP